MTILVLLAVVFVAALIGAVIAMRRDLLLAAAFALGTASAALIHLVLELL
ncbi:hypothetical protein [Streptomyces iconiensis]|uniref:Uncharacterized protein n=1 Tax=Streptomyces iconiensis TaxID=1384038 RepID=A0ABT6ZQ84_9ACTN|nr:hypothetical protein [Streptomyces iconiensis]MDJ1131213.1 hypothetical protein [Streptomyces iconiensis]